MINAQKKYGKNRGYMYRDYFIGYIEYFFITTGFGLLWISGLLTYVIIKFINRGE